MHCKQSSSTHLNGLCWTSISGNTRHQKPPITFLYTSPSSFLTPCNNERMANGENVPTKNDGECWNSRSAFTSHCTESRSRNFSRAVNNGSLSFGGRENAISRSIVPVRSAHLWSPEFFIIPSPFLRQSRPRARAAQLHLSELLRLKAKNTKTPILCVYLSGCNQWGWRGGCRINITGMGNYNVFATILFVKLPAAIMKPLKLKFILLIFRLPWFLRSALNMIMKKNKQKSPVCFHYIAYCSLDPQCPLHWVSVLHKAIRSWLVGGANRVLYIPS